MDIDIRKGIKKDLPQVLALIKELADYEKSLHQVDVTLEQLEKDGFDGHPHYYLLVAEEKEEIIGVCFYFIRYSTWKGKVLFLEDFVVKEEYRRKGFAKLLMNAAKQYASDNNFGSIELSTGKTNTQGQSLYESLGYIRDNEYYTYDLEI